MIPSLRCIFQIYMRHVTMQSISSDRLQDLSSARQWDKTLSLELLIFSSFHVFIGVSRPTLAIPRHQ